MVKSVEAEEKIDEREDMRAESRTASISPRTPSGISSITSTIKAMLEHPDLHREKARRNRYNTVSNSFSLRFVVAFT